MKTLRVSIPIKWDDNGLPNGVAIKSRKVAVALAPWDGEYTPLEHIREPNQASKDPWTLL